MKVASCRNSLFLRLIKSAFLYFQRNGSFVFVQTFFWHRNLTCRKKSAFLCILIADLKKQSGVGKFCYPTSHYQVSGNCTKQSLKVLKCWNRSVVRVPDSSLQGRGLESLQERWENFLLQGQLSVLTLILGSIPPPCYHSSMQKFLVILPKVQVAGYS